MASPRRARCLRTAPLPRDCARWRGARCWGALGNPPPSPAFDSRLVGKRLEVCWPYKETGKTVKIWACGTVKRVADGLTDRTSKRAQKVLPRCPPARRCAVAVPCCGRGRALGDESCVGRVVDWGVVYSPMCEKIPYTLSDITGHMSAFSLQSTLGSHATRHRSAVAVQRERTALATDTLSHARLALIRSLPVAASTALWTSLTRRLHVTREHHSTELHSNLLCCHASSHTCDVTPPLQSRRLLGIDQPRYIRPLCEFQHGDQTHVSSYVAL